MQKFSRQRKIPAIAALSLAFGALAGCGGGSGSSGLSSSLADTPTTGVQDSGSGSTASAPPPASASAATGSARLSWRAPTSNTDGTPLTNLAGFYIRYGWSQSHMDQVVKIASVNILNCEIAGLPVGTVFYFAVSSYTTSGVESDKSLTVSKKI